VDGSTFGSASILSVGGLLYQAECLVERLASFTSDDYPAQTLSIAKIFQLLAERSRSELSKLDAATTSGLTLGEQNRARDLGNIVQVLHSYLRYLQASAPLHTPPGIQQAITALIETHAKEVLDCKPEDINVLVRPQWKYSLKYVDILHQFDSEAPLLWYALDPQHELNAFGVREIVKALWHKADGDADAAQQSSNTFATKIAFPKHCAIVSFAGLDRDDVLLYPLLAHELGHFLDFALEDSDSESTASTLYANLPSATELEGYGLETTDHRALAEAASVCLRELTADLLAARMVGLGYYFAFNEYFKCLDVWPGDEVVNSKSGYPSFGLRLKLVWQELSASTGGIGAVEALEDRLAKWKQTGKEELRKYVADSASLAEAVKLPQVAEAQGNAAAKLEILTTNTIVKSLPAVLLLVRKLIPDARAARLPDDIEDMVELLKTRVPPFQPFTRDARKKKDYKSWKFEDILTAGWLYQLAMGDPTEAALPQSQRSREYRSSCLLLLKALELQGSADAISAILRDNSKTQHQEKASGPPPGNKGGVLSGSSLREALNRKSTADRLVICPDFGDGPLEAASRDLHLGHWFRVFKRTSLPQIDLTRADSVRRARSHGQLEVFVPNGQQFVLQPGDFALAISLEYICLPPDMMAFVEGKSSLGRAGLIIATATQVAPGFKGCIVLELFNAGTVPVIVKPAMRVAQLVIVATDVSVDNKWLYSGDFQVQIKP
jgi:dCTP deaminase